MVVLINNFVLLDLNFIWKKNECVLLHGPVGKCIICYNGCWLSVAIP